MPCRMESKEKSSAMSRKMILVGGMPRSGTTLLSRLIGERFRIPFSPETHYFSLAYKQGELVLENLPREAIEERRVEDAYRKIINQPRSVRTFRILLSEILNDSPIVGEKTPAHLTAFSEILATDSNVTCLVIVRDFFEVIESLRKVDWNNASFLANLKRCIRYHQITYHTQRRFPDRLIVVDYRTLCENEQRVITALLKRLPQGSNSEAQQIFDPELEPWKKNALSAPEVICREVPLKRMHQWLIAKFSRLACSIIWPITTAHNN